MQAIEAEQVLGDNHQASLGSDASESASVKAVKATIAFAVGIRKFNGLAAEAIALLNFRVSHLRALCV